MEQDRMTTAGDGGQDPTRTERPFAKMAGAGDGWRRREDSWAT